MVLWRCGGTARTCTCSSSSSSVVRGERSVVHFFFHLFFDFYEIFANNQMSDVCVWRGEEAGVRLPSNYDAISLNIVLGAGGTSASEQCFSSFVTMTLRPFTPSK